MPETSRGQTDPRVVQLSVFLANRLGALRQLVQRLAEAEVRILGLAVLDAADHAVVRLVVDRPAKATSALTEAGYGMCETEVLAVQVPVGARGAVHKVLSALVGAEVNIAYVYGLLGRLEGRALVALQTDDSSMAERVLRGRGFELVHQEDLADATDA
jgi:hypothetical protein